MKFFTKVLRDALAADANALTGKTLRLVLFRNAPKGSVTFDYGVVPTLQKLLDGNYPGWETIDHPAEYTSRLPVSITTTSKGTAQVDFSSFVLTGLTKKVEVMAMGVEVVGTFWGETNPLLFVTDEPFPNGRIVLDKNEDAILAVASKTVGVNNNWLFGLDGYFRRCCSGSEPDAGRAGCVPRPTGLPLSTPLRCLDVSAAGQLHLQPQLRSHQQ